MSQAFSRFHRIMATIAAAMSATSLGRADALASAGGYQSRGKGRGNVTYARSGTTAQDKRASVKARNVQRNKAAHR